jgi:hypothetical protein
VVKPGSKEVQQGHCGMPGQQYTALLLEQHTVVWSA